MYIFLENYQKAVKTRQNSVRQNKKHRGKAGKAAQDAHKPQTNPNLSKGMRVSTEKHWKELPTLRALAKT
jgi:hypothetical protein